MRKRVDEGGGFYDYVDVDEPSNASLDAKVIEIDSKRRRFKLYADLEASINKEWLVDGLLGHGEASCMYGAPGSGKSVLAEDMALHIAAGRPWHGRPVRRGLVVFIALERARLVERRAIAFRLHHGIADLPFAIISGVYDFRDLRTVATILDIVKEVEAATGETAVLIVIDTLSRALAGGDENSPKDMGAVVTSTARLQEATQAHVLWVHHVPLDAGERMRGHGALLGAMDTTMKVDKGAVRVATVVKANDAEEGEQVAFTLQSIIVGDDGVTTAPVVVPEDGRHHRPATPTRKLSDRQRLALAALTESTLQVGKPAPAEWQLPSGVNVVTMEAWRDQIMRSNVVDAQHPNPRKEFQRLRDALAARNLIGTRENMVWSALRSVA